VIGCEEKEAIQESKSSNESEIANVYGQKEHNGEQQWSSSIKQSIKVRVNDSYSNRIAARKRNKRHCKDEGEVRSSIGNLFVFET